MHDNTILAVRFNNFPSVNRVGFYPNRSADPEKPGMGLTFWIPKWVWVLKARFLFMSRVRVPHPHPVQTQLEPRT